MTAKHPPFLAGPGCAPTKADIFRFANEGSLFLGCVITTTPNEAAAAAQAAGLSEQPLQPAAPSKLRAADLVKKSTETFLMLQHTIVDGSGNYYYVKASKTTWATLRNTKGMTSFPGAMKRTTLPTTPASAAAAAPGIESPAVAVGDVSNVVAAAADEAVSAAASAADTAEGAAVDATPVADDAGRHHHHRRALQQLSDNRARPSSTNSYPFWNLAR